MSLSDMSERKSVICERNSEFEESSIKKMRLDDLDSDVYRSLTRTISFSSTSLAYSASDSEGFSVASSEEDDHRSSSICSSSETNEIATDTRFPLLDLEANQISETEVSTLITNNFRSEILGETAEMDSATTERRDERKTEKKVEKSPTQAELNDFFSAAERYEQKRFTEK